MAPKTNPKPHAKATKPKKDGKPAAKATQPEAATPAVEAQHNRLNSRSSATPSCGR